MYYNTFNNLTSFKHKLQMVIMKQQSVWGELDDKLKVMRAEPKIRWHQ